MKKTAIFLFILTSVFAFFSCDKKEELANSPSGCCCSPLVDCEAECACGCQD
jgi:hypothetical protein